MDGLPLTFRRGNEGSVASYDWIDLTSGFGYKKFYLTNGSLTGGTVQRFLITESIESEPASIDGDFDSDWDNEFKVPAYVKGDAVFNVYRYCPNNVTHSYVVTIYHVTAGGVETSIGTATGTTFTGFSASGAAQRATVKITLTPKNFGIGEKIRVTLVVTDANGTATTYFNNGTTGQDCLVFIPFKIDL